MRGVVVGSRSVSRRRCDSLVIFFNDASSLLVILDMAFGELARTKAKCAVVTLAEHVEEHECKEWLGKDVQDAVPEELQDGNSGR